MKNTFSHVETLPLSDRISHLIEEAIMNGRIRPGERINTDELAREFKVSHIPIREALKKLGAVGLVVLEANKSARALELSTQDVRHIFEVRKVLEGLAAYLAANHMDTVSKNNLQKIVKKMRETAKAKNLAGMFNADKKFHETLWNLSENPFLIKTLNHLLLPYFGFIAARGYYAHLDDLSYVPRIHQELLDALSSKDGNRAQRTIMDMHTRSMALMLS